MSISINEIRNVRTDFDIEPLRKVTLESGSFQDQGLRTYDEISVGFTGGFRAQHLRELLESQSYAKALIDEKWPDGIPTGRVSAVSGRGDLYLDIPVNDGCTDFSVGMWALSQISSIEQYKEHLSFSSLCGEKYEIKKSHIKLAISTTPPEEGLMGLCLRMVRIAIANKRIQDNAKISFFSTSNTLNCFQNDEPLSGRTFDKNLQWILQKLDLVRDTRNELIVRCMPEHTAIAFFRSTISDTKCSQLGTLELQLSSSMRMFKMLPMSAKEIVREKWDHQVDKLLNGKILVTPCDGMEYTTKLREYYSSAEEVLAVLGAKRIGKKFKFGSNKSPLLFTEDECRLAAMITPLECGMIGICENLARLSFLRKEFSGDYKQFLSMMFEMGESGYVEGIDLFINNAVERVKVANLVDKGNDRTINGLYAEMKAIHSEFLGIVLANGSTYKSPEFELKKLYMRISEQVRGSEIDIKVFQRDRTGEEVAIRVIEVKNTLQTFVKKIYEGGNQFMAYLRECEKNTNDCGDKCSLDIYIPSTDIKLLNQRVFVRNFFEKLKDEYSIESPRLDNFLAKTSPDGEPLPSYTIKEVLDLALSELLQLRASLTSKDIVIRLWLWDSDYDRFSRFNCRSVSSRQYINNDQ